MVTCMKDKNISHAIVRNANKIRPDGMATRVLLIKYSGFVFIIITNTHNTRAKISSTSSHYYWEPTSSLTWDNTTLTWTLECGRRPSPAPHLTLFSLFCRFKATWQVLWYYIQTPHHIHHPLTLPSIHKNQNNPYTPTKRGILCPKKTIYCS